MSNRTPDKWFAMRTDFFGRDSYQLGFLELTPRAQALFVTSVAYICRWGIDECHAGVARMAGMGRPKQIIDELVTGEFWAPGVRGKGWYLVCHEGTLWRRGDGKQRKSIPKAVRAFVFQRDGHACVLCGATESLSLDHVHPYSLGGDDSPANLRVLCVSCNSSKGARLNGS